MFSKLGKIVLVAMLSWAIGFLLMVADALRLGRSFGAVLNYVVEMGPASFAIVMLVLPLVYAPVLMAFRKWVTRRRPRLMLPLVASVVGIAMFTHFVTRLDHPLDVSYLIRSFWPQYAAVVAISASFGLGYAKWAGT